MEPDASSASYFHAVNALFPAVQPVNVMACEPPRAAGGTGWQIDAEFPRLAPTAGSSADGAGVEAVAKRRKLEPEVVSRKTDLGDSIMTAIAIAPLAATAHRFASLGVLRKQECERVAALRDELRKCKATVHETVETDTLDVTPSAAADLGGATVATYHDHRMAMCFATLALKVGGIKIEGPSCVRKTVPSFFQILGAPPPHGLGVEIWECDAATGARVRRLDQPDDLFAAK